MKLVAFSLVLLFLYGFTAQDQFLNVHVVPHTHDDVGWLKTVDQYFVGSREDIQDAGVQYIIDSVITALQENTNRTFIYVEMAFFTRWWREQTDQKKQVVKQLVASGRLEFINGGWCMNDEATTYYPSIIDQMTRGHLFLKNEFNVTPTIGWHIDPFGHSSSQARLFAEMGFNAFFFSRIDYQDYQLRTSQQRMEMIWRSSPSLGSKADMFTSVNFGGYGPPPGFCWDCGDDPIQDDPNLFDMNVDAKSTDFANHIRNEAKAFRTNNVMLYMGSDFQYKNANLNFKNIDKLINYINANTNKYNMKLMYSTPSKYIAAVNAAGLTWEVKTDDFFPYADGPHAYWTGYFTSRPGVKFYERFTQSLYHSADLLYSLSGLPAKAVDPAIIIQKIGVLGEALGVAQHHDAVSGTEKQHVAFDYAKRLSIGMYSAYDAMNTVASVLLAKESFPTFTFCPLLNISSCPSTETAGFVTIVAYNPSGQSRSEIVRVPVPSDTVVVSDSNQNAVTVQISQDLTGKKVAYFSVIIPPFGLSTYFLKSKPSPKSSSSSSSSLSLNKKKKRSVATATAGPVVLENSFVQVTFDENGKLTSVVNKRTNEKLQVTQEYLWYVPSTGDSSDGQASGAYIFRESKSDPQTFPAAQVEYVSNTANSLVQEVRTRVNGWIVQSIRIYNNSEWIEVESNVGPVDVSDNQGKEVISRFTTNLATQSLFYTDSNGLEYLQRKRNYRPSWNLTVTQPIGGNYYPVNSFGFIQDSKSNQQFSVVTDRSQGGSSINDGQFELMVNRRLTRDDGRGVGEALSETIDVRIKEILTFDQISSSMADVRSAQQKLNKPITLMFSTSATSAADWINNFATSFAPLESDLPSNVELLNAQVIAPGTLLLRLHHLYAAGEDATLSKPVTVDLNALFPTLKFNSITETSLSANQALSDVHRLPWKTASNEEGGKDKKNSKKQKRKRQTQAYPVTLNPMEIKTYLINFQPSF